MDRERIYLCSSTTETTLLNSWRIGQKHETVNEHPFLLLAATTVSVQAQGRDETCR